MPSHDARLFLAGRYVDPASDESVPVRSPVTGEHLADLPVPTAGQVDEAVRAARAAFEDYRRWSAYERAVLCHAIADLIEARADSLARLTTTEQGKPYHSEAHGDVEDTASLFRVSAEDSLRLYGETIPSSARGKRMLTWRAPVGVWAAVTPWNFPLMIAAEFIAPALATVSILPGDGFVGERLVTHPGVDAIGFVGSSATAERIVRAAGLKRSLIEASGNGPVIVLADADVGKAAQAVVYGAYWNAGQVCCATERVLVDSSIAGEFAVAVVKAAGEVVLGDPFDEATTMGPLCNELTAAKMDRHVADAVGSGATVLLGGKRSPGRPTDLYYELTVLDGVRPDMLVAREESFGPIVPLVAADGDDALLAIANSDQLGLQAAVFTQSLHRAFRFSEELRVGSVVVNDSTDYFENAQPFGGAGGTRTGWGRVGGLAQLRDMTDVRTTIFGLD